jgi:hypothetical protein
MPPKTSFARFTPFSRGKIVGKAEEGASTKAIRKTVLKKDGRLASLRAIDAVVAKAKSDPSWQGEDSSAGGRPPAFTPSQVSAAVNACPPALQVFSFVYFSPP